MSSGDRALGPLGARLQRWLAGPLDDDLRRKFAVETTDSNCRRLRLVAPIMVVLHAAHVALFHAGGAMRASLPAGLLRWRDDLVLVHGATLVFALALWVAVRFFARTRVAHLFAPLAALGYLVHGAAIAGVDQLAMANVTAFLGYALGVGLVASLTPLATLVVYPLGLACFIAAIDVMQPSANARLLLLPNGYSSVVIGMVLSLVVFAARRRDFAQRATIGAQREELARINESLERRVRGQVSEIVERARQVEELNAQLRAQVRARSTELSMALTKLAQHRAADGRLARGFVLGDRFVVEEPIGEGGMGSVYSGLDRSSGARVAIKVIQAGSAQELDALHRFLREARTAAQIAHPVVVRMLHVDVSADGMLFQVQELVEGETLHVCLADRVPWEPGMVARLGAVLCDALAAAHAEGVVHRDVKPGNMMLTATPPGLKLLDFGISKLLRGHTGDGSSGSGKIIGTPAYMAPETVMGRELTDRADVYAVGVILFRTLTATFPFDDASTRDVLVKQVTLVAPDVRTLRRETPPELATIVARCLAQEPEDRPSARETASALAAFANAAGAPGLDVLARRLSVRVRVRPRDESATVAEGRKTPG